MRELRKNQVQVWKSQDQNKKMPMRTKCKLTLTHLIIEKRNLEENADL